MCAVSVTSLGDLHCQPGFRGARATRLQRRFGAESATPLQVGDISGSTMNGCTGTARHRVSLTGSPTIGPFRAVLRRFCRVGATLCRGGTLPWESLHRSCFVLQISRLLLSEGGLVSGATVHFQTTWRRGSNWIPSPAAQSPVVICTVLPLGLRPQRSEGANRGPPPARSWHRQRQKRTTSAPPTTTASATPTSLPSPRSRSHFVSLSLLFFTTSPPTLKPAPSNPASTSAQLLASLEHGD